MDYENEKIIFINNIGDDGEEYIYDLYFTDDLDLVWGENWNVKPASICGSIPPTNDSFNYKIRIETSIKIDVAQNNSCFSMQDCMSGVVALGWENIDDYEVFEPEERLIIRYGETYNEIIEKLNNKEINIV